MPLRIVRIEGADARKRMPPTRAAVNVTVLRQEGVSFRISMF